MHYTDQGAGTPVVWIHGFPLSSRVFQHQLEIAGVRHIVPDLPGFGRSSYNPTISTIDDYARRVRSLVDQLDLQRVVFAGLSMGGYVCFSLARMAAERMLGLILIDTRETADTPEARKDRFATIEKVKQHGVSVVADSMLPKMLTRAAPPELIDDVRSIMTSCTPEGVMTALRAMADRPDSADVLRRLRVPTLIVVGEEDPITPKSDAERMAGLQAQSTLVTIPRAAHLSNLERPREFNEAVRHFTASSNEGASPPWHGPEREDEW